MWLGDSTAGDSIINIGKKVKERLMIDANVSPFCRKNFLQKFIISTIFSTETRITENSRSRCLIELNHHFFACHKVLTKKLFYIEIQWGIEYQTPLDFEWLKVVGCWFVWISNGILNPNKMGAILNFTIF